jgi:hypothetical protein
MDLLKPEEDKEILPLQTQALSSLQEIVEDAVRRLVLPEIQALKGSQQQADVLYEPDRGFAQVAALPGESALAPALAARRPVTRPQIDGPSMKGADREPSATYSLMEIDDRVWELVDVDEPSTLYHDVEYWKSCAKCLAAVVSKLTMLVDGSHMSVSRYRMIHELLQGLERRQSMAEPSKRSPQTIQANKKPQRTEAAIKRADIRSMDSSSTVSPEQSSRQLAGTPYSCDPTPVSNSESFSSPPPESGKHSKPAPVARSRSPQLPTVQLPPSPPSNDDSSRSPLSRFFKRASPPVPQSRFKELPPPRSKSSTIPTPAEERPRHRPSPQMGRNTAFLGPDSDAEIRNWHAMAKRREEVSKSKDT